MTLTFFSSVKGAKAYPIGVAANDASLMAVSMCLNYKIDGYTESIWHPYIAISTWSEAGTGTVESSRIVPLGMLFSIGMSEYGSCASDLDLSKDYAIIMSQQAVETLPGTSGTDAYPLEPNFDTTLAPEVFMVALDMLLNQSRTSSGNSADSSQVQRLPFSTDISLSYEEKIRLDIEDPRPGKSAVTKAMNADIPKVQVCLESHVAAITVQGDSKSGSQAQVYLYEQEHSIPEHGHGTSHNNPAPSPTASIPRPWSQVAYIETGRSTVSVAVSASEMVIAYDSFRNIFPQ